MTTRDLQALRTGDKVRPVAEDETYRVVRRYFGAVIVQSSRGTKRSINPDSAHAWTTRAIKAEVSFQ